MTLSRQIGHKGAMGEIPALGASIKSPVLLMSDREGEWYGLIHLVFFIYKIIIYKSLRRFYRMEEIDVWQKGGTA